MYWLQALSNSNKPIRNPFNSLAAFVFFCAAAISFSLIQEASCNESASGSTTTAVSQDAVSQDYQDAARKAYHGGDYGAAILALESRLKDNPNDEKAKNLLSEVLIAASVEDYLGGSEEKSYQTLTRALEIAPSLEAANKMYDKVRKERFAGAAGSRNAGLPADAAQFEQIIGKMVQGQKELLSQNRSSLEQILQQSGSEKRGILQSLEKREEMVVREIQYGRKAQIWLIVAFIMGVAFIVAMVLYIFQKTAARREQSLMEQNEKFIQLVQDQSQQSLEYMKEGLKEGLERISISVTPPPAPLPEPSARSMVSPRLSFEEDTASKLRKIDIIDAEIVVDGGAPATKDKEALYALLQDPDPTVRARTVQVLFKTDPDEAYRRVEEMLANPLVGIRLMGIRLLGGMANEKSTEILIRLLSETDTSVKRETIAALKILLSENLPENSKAEIDRALSAVSEKEGWIVK